MKYTGRPSNTSKAFRTGELNRRSSREQLAWINKQLDSLAPNDHFIVTPTQHTHVLIDTVRNRLANLNRIHKFNLKLHKDDTDNWWIWHCPDSRKFNRHGTAIDPTKPKAKHPLQSSGSIHATTEQVLSHLSINQTTFDALPFDQQMKLRIQVGIALRDQRTKLTKLNQIFKPPTKPPTNDVGN
jgi:hypothetical protein